ncbi:MAG TPA: NAD-dependent epimerase/dehydratase family protein [Planctomycetota bacterium]|nr:NAD-dependent epimerase/dehydratase family protein [Planctomycetota bacterium]
MGRSRFARVLVTGGAGFIGSRLVPKLREAGSEVVVLDDLSTGTRDRVPPGVPLVVGDVRDGAACERAVAGCDAVIHLAAVVSVRRSVEEFLPDAETNALGTLRVLAAARKAKVRRFVYASSMAVYADSPDPRPLPETHATRPLSPYGVSKLAGEHYALLVGRDSAIPSVALRYFNAYGPGQTFTPYVGVVTIFVNRCLRGERPVVFGDGEQRRDFVHVDDLAEATRLALESEVDGEAINVGTGHATSVNEIAAAITSRLAPKLGVDRGPEVPGEMRNAVADIGKAKKLLGYAPSRPRPDFDDVIRYWRK